MSPSLAQHVDQIRDSQSDDSSSCNAKRLVSNVLAKQAVRTGDYSNSSLCMLRKGLDDLATNNDATRDSHTDKTTSQSDAAESEISKSNEVNTQSTYEATKDAATGQANSRSVSPDYNYDFEHGVISVSDSEQNIDDIGDKQVIKQSTSKTGSGLNKGRKRNVDVNFVQAGAEEANHVTRSARMFRNHRKVDESMATEKRYTALGEFETTEQDLVDAGIDCKSKRKTILHDIQRKLSLEQKAACHDDESSVTIKKPVT